MDFDGVSWLSSSEPAVSASQVEEQPHCIVYLKTTKDKKASKSWDEMRYKTEKPPKGPLCNKKTGHLKGTYFTTSVGPVFKNPGPEVLFACSPSVFPFILLVLFFQTLPPVSVSQPFQIGTSRPVVALTRSCSGSEQHRSCRLSKSQYGRKVV